jgi:hypothetical protein
MPRRQFQADLQKAADGTSIAGIAQVRPGEDDGMFTFMCIADGHQLEISALLSGKSTLAQKKRPNTKPYLRSKDGLNSPFRGVQELVEKVEL